MFGTGPISRSTAQEHVCAGPAAGGAAREGPATRNPPRASRVPVHYARLPRDACVAVSAVTAFLPDSGTFVCKTTMMTKCIL